MAVFVSPHPANPALGPDLIGDNPLKVFDAARFPLEVGVSPGAPRVKIDFGGDTAILPKGISYVIPHMEGGTITILDWNEEPVASLDTGLSGTPTLRIEVDLADGRLADLDIQRVS